MSFLSAVDFLCRCCLFGLTWVVCLFACLYLIGFFFSCPVSRDVQGKGTFLTTLRLKPAKPGQKQIIAIFNSKQLEGIDGTHDINIRA